MTVVEEGGEECRVSSRAFGVIVPLSAAVDLFRAMHTATAQAETERQTQEGASETETTDTDRHTCRSALKLCSDGS
eukprot:3086655-Rhodomonas_salina.2